jgi:hypothetical protein
LCKTCMPSRRLLSSALLWQVQGLSWLKMDYKICIIDDINFVTIVMPMCHWFIFQEIYGTLRVLHLSLNQY